MAVLQLQQSPVTYLMSWDVKLFGYNVRCRVCKKVYHKSVYKSVAEMHRVCPFCRKLKNAKGIVLSAERELKRKEREVREYMKQKGMRIKWKKKKPFKEAFSELRQGL